jgi:renal tumor antigen
MSLRVNGGLCSGKLALVFELMDQNLYEVLVEDKNLNPKKLKVYMYQLLKAIEYVHSKGIFHRDIKPENVLVKDDCIKLADFGSCKGMLYAR